MPSYEAGDAFLQVLPSMRGFNQRLKRELAGVRVEFQVPVTFEIDRRGLADLATALRALPAVVIDADTSPADREIAAVRERIERLSGQTIGIDISGDDARRELDSIRSDLERLGATAPQISVRVDAAAAEATVAAIQREVSRLDGRRVNLRVVADVAHALTSIASVAFAVNQFANKSYSFRVDADVAGAAAAIAGLVAKVGALGGLAGIVGGLGGALGGLGAAGVVAGAGLGATVLASLGVGKALTALNAQQDAAGQTAQQSAKQQATAADAVASAQARLRQASVSADRARTEGARSVADAEKAASRQVEQALRAQATAQKALRQATSDLEREQASLTRAWEEGRRGLQDLQSQVRGNSIDQRQAAQDLKDAEKDLAAARAGGDPDEINRATIAYDRQRATVDDLATQGQRLAADNAEAQRKGVAGSDQVVAANDRIAAATDRAQAAAAAASDADAAVTEARTAGADSVARAQEQASQRIADADLQVVEANRALTKALADTGETGSTAANNVATAFADLSPEAAAFATYLFGLKPLLQDLSGVAAKEFFPPLQAGIGLLVGQGPAITGIVSKLAAAMGLGLKDVLTQLASPYWMSFFQLLADSAGSIIPSLFAALMNVASAGTVLIRVLLPLAPAAFALLNQIAGLVATLAPFIAQLLGGLIPAASAFLSALTPLGPVLAALQPILLVLGQAFSTVLAAVLQALAPVLVALTPLIQALALQFADSLVASIQAATPLLVMLADWLSANPGLVIGVITVLGGLAGAFKPLLFVLGIAVSALHSFLIIKIAQAALTAFGLQGTVVGQLILRLLSPLNLLRMVLPLIGRLILMLGRSLLAAMGPIGWIITGLSLLYSSNEQFRTAVNGVLQVLLGLVGTLVGALMPAFQTVLSAVMPLIGVLGSALTPVINLVAGVLVDLINTVLPPLVQIITTFVIPVITTLANILATVLVWVITHIVVPAIEALSWYISNILVPVILWLWQNIVKPAFEAIATIVTWAVNNILVPLFNAVVWVLTKVIGPAFEAFWHDVIEPVWNGIGTVITWVWEHVIKPSWDAIGAGLDWLKGGFETAVAWIGDKWRGLKNLLAVPINFMIGTVFNNGIRKAWNFVADLLPGIEPIAELPLIPEFRSGGPLRGRGTGTSDDILMYGSNGEHMVTAAEVSGAGGHGNVERVRQMWAAGVPVGDPRYYAAGGPVIPGYADGGPIGWQQMWDTVRGQFPTSRLTSALRPGDPGYHGKGQAIDVAGARPMDAYAMSGINRWIARAFPDSTELIHTPGINLKNGQPHVYNAATQADHRDHVHWAMAAASGSVGGEGGGFFDWIGDQVRAAFTTITDPAISALEAAFPAPPKFMRIPAEAARSMRDKALDFMLGKAADAGSTGEPAGAGVQRWAPLVQQALGMLGLPTMLVQTTLRRMQQESGGNPRAINNWDINATRGTPSKGLMQVIDPTFRANRDLRAPNDIWDPLANVLASMKYALGRYGSLPAAYDRKGGYDSGGIARGIGLMWKGTGLDERVLDPVETQAYPTLTRLSQQLEAGRLPVPAGVSADQAAAMTSSGRQPGGDTYNLHFHEATWDERRMFREIDRRRELKNRTT